MVSRNENSAGQDGTDRRDIANTNRFKQVMEFRESRRQEGPAKNKRSYTEDRSKRMNVEIMAEIVGLFFVYSLLLYFSFSQLQRLMCLLFT